MRSTTDAVSINCAQLLERINARIEHLIDSDHCIGHGYFVGCDTNAKVIERLATKVIPLLREYFYGNEGLMLLVLGDSPSQAVNFFDVIPPETQFSKIFGVDADTASALVIAPTRHLAASRSILASGIPRDLFLAQTTKTLQLNAF